MDGTRDVEPGDPEVVICLDEFGPLNLQPHPAASGPAAAGADPSRAAGGEPPSSGRTGCATCSPPTTCHGTGYGHVKARKRRGELLTFLRYVRFLYPRQVRLAIVSD
jgi:hypothetical protein